jgi:hypothetical protein
MGTELPTKVMLGANAGFNANDIFK